MKKTMFERMISVLLCLALLLSCLPAQALFAWAADGEGTGYWSTIADPATLTRPGMIYGDNTMHTGKITVGKSVSNSEITVNGQTITLEGLNNFLVTISQSAQTMGLTTESSVPVDVVFVLDTSGSMEDNNRAEAMVTATNSAIATLMATNEQNRVAVVAFSSENYGGGTADGEAASVLSSLAHYTGDAATAHLQWVNNSGGTNGGNRNYIAGRDTVRYGNGTANAFRHGKDGGTNMQAGILAGTKLLTSVSNTSWTDPETNETVTRIPFLVVLSDGQATFTYDDSTWYDPALTNTYGDNQQGPGSGSYEGVGFITAMTAAYCKGKITEHYYGSQASADQHAFVYTMGVEIESLSGDNLKMAQITLDPKTYAVAGQDYYTYGNSWDSNRNQNTTHGWGTYWTNYQNGSAFNVRVDNERTFQFTANSIAASKGYVNGIGYTGGLQYNDRYFAVDEVANMESIFQALVGEISMKAISSPTKVTTGDHNFDGYVNFYDPIGEYMEVKDMKGILANGYFFQGMSFAQNLANYGTAQADPEFDTMLRQVIKTRMGLSSADDRFASETALDAFVDELLAAARASANQAYYNNANDFDNSIVWWGSAYNSGEEDQHVQMIGFADNDSLDYIEAQRAAGTIPAGADYVCRSYFFYGEAGGTNPNPEHKYLYFMVRVQRELTWPYRETVVISAPASLLSVEKVMINETFDADGNPVYTATVTHQEPARVVYEVGLWDTINEENVSYIVTSDYTNEKVNGIGSANYDAATDTYHFFSNDWDRTQSLDSHHRGMAKATFDAASDNPFYTYQQDTLIVDANGNPVTSNPSGTTAYYVREYYQWAADGNVDGTYDATKQTILVQVEIPTDANLKNEGGRWYIPEGAYTGATLVVNGDDTMKDDPSTSTPDDGNWTGTSSIVAHPHRTGDVNNSHYTVFLGNNGKLSLKANPYTPTKTSSINLPGDATTIVDDQGNTVQVGDVLTYTIEVKNIMTTPMDITITDRIPTGTAFVPGSAAVGTAPTGHTPDASIVPDSNQVLTWVLNDVPAGETRYVSFQVTVTEEALNMNVVSGNIENQATVTIGNMVTIQSNTTQNAPYGKTVTDVNGVDIDGTHGYKVGDTLVYHIRFHNNAVDASGNFVAANVTVTDRIPAGTTFVSADNGGTFDAATGMVTWNFDNMTANAAKIVSFQVKINASAKINAEGVQPEAGEIYLPNTATVTVNTTPMQTNTTENWADVGNMVISKVVAQGGDTEKVFTMNLTETSGLLSGQYPMTGGDATFVEFREGKASVAIKHGQTLTIQGLPAGVVITVEEDTSALPGWTPTYNTQSVTITKGAATAVSSVSVTNTYTLQPLTVTIQGVKNMSGATMASPVTFGFVATPHADNVEVGDPLTGEVTVDGNGAFTFRLSAKTFTKPGVYKYTITEIDGGVQGVNYDRTAHVLEINVTDNGDGTMSATAKLNDASFDLINGAVPFSNSYAPASTQLELVANKQLIGRDLNAGEFSFQLTDGTNTYKGIHTADGKIYFETIVFTQAGTYTYTMTEVVPTATSGEVEYDTRSYTVVVTVNDEGGQLVPTVTVGGQQIAVVNGEADTGITFVNTFVPDDVPLVLVANKTLKVYDVAAGVYKDETPAAGQFRFQVVEKATGNVVTTGTNAADGTITFNAFYFSAAMLQDVTPDSDGNKTGTFTYVISEVVSDLTKDPNMRYDLEGREVVVTLTYTADGKLIVSVNGDSDGTVDLTGPANFINYGNPSSVSVTPTGKKTTTGSNLPAGLSFSFKVVPVNGSQDAAIGTSNETVGGTNSETSDITFSTMVYTHESLGDAETRTFQYWIMESNATAGDNGVVYDTTRYLYQVTLSRDEFGRLIATEQYFALRDGGDAENPADYTEDVTNAGIRFTNTYDAKASINLVAYKELTGRDPGLATGEFDFLLHRLDADGRIIPGSEITGYNSASGRIRFATMNYSNAMLTDAYKHTDGAFYFSYLMRELKPEGVAVPGVTYDTSLYVVTIKVTQTADGMTAELANVSRAVENNGLYSPGTPVSGFTAEGDTAVTFTNVYQAVEGDVVQYQLKKDLIGRDIREGEFRFGLYHNGELVDVVTNDANGIITFHREIPATAAQHAGVYKVVIKELPGSLSGVTYSTQEFVVYVKVVDNGTGKIEATIHLTEDGAALPEDANGMVDLTGEFVFVNTYEPYDTYFTPAVSKELTGRDQIAGEFSFQAQLINKDGVAVKNGKIYYGLNDAKGNVIFDAITFSEVGTFVYRISETEGSIRGVAYDTSAYYLKVTVVDDGNGHLQASGAYFADAACTQTISGVVFHNTFTPDDVEVQLKGDKELIGRDMADNEFSFVVRKDDVNGPIVATGSNDASGKILFSTFKISAADLGGATSKTFTYVIVESDNKAPGIIYAAPVTVTVTVTNENGVLVAQVHYPEGESAKFVNRYVANGTFLPLTGYKTLNGKNLAAGEFTFLLKDAQGNVLQTVTNDAGGVIRFENLVFTDADMLDAEGNRVMRKEFLYTVSEQSGSVAGMEYDKTVYEITVTVIDDGQGNLTATAIYKTESGNAEHIHFVNSYTPAAIQVELEGSKLIVDTDGKELMDAAHSPAGFKFQIFDAAGNLVTTATSDENGNFKFANLTFTAAGEYRFTIREEITNRPGYTTDPTVWCAHIVIGYNADTGRLYEQSKEVHVLIDGHADATTYAQVEMVFVNTYAPADVSLVLKAMKKLDGRELRDHEFIFYMVDKATGLRAAEGRNTANGEISFYLTYTSAGVYEYTIYELIPTEGKLDGVTYSTQTYDVTVTVVDDGSGALKVLVGEITTSGSATMDLTETVVFHNTYKAGPVEESVEAKKQLVGKDLAEGDFSFLLKDAEGNVLQTVTNDALGNIHFAKLTFTEAGIYTYTISERKGQMGGVYYDEAVFTVTITVKDNYNGSLYIASKVYTDADGKLVELPTFINTYTAGAVEATVDAKKQLVGKDLVAGDFTFILKDAEGNVLQTATNHASGNIHFAKLTFTKAGTYTYTISEQKGQLGGVTYDEAVYTVTIIVKDDGNGNLFVESKVYTDAAGKTVELPTFVNTYTAGASEETLDAKKELIGKDLAAGDFTFVLKDDEGNVLQTVTNDALGNIHFTKLTFAKAGTYTYTISEQKGQLGGVTYDEAVYTVTIIVKDDGNGNLFVESKVYTDAAGKTVELPTFVNTYTAASTEDAVEAKKELVGKDLAAGDFTFILKDAEGNVLQTVTNDALGNIRFEKLTFAKAGTYTYTISEQKGQLGGVTYDEAVYTVTITVKDDGNGNLFVESKVYTDADGKTVELPTFVNTYKASSVSYAPQISKIFEGAAMREFWFLLTGEGFESQTKSNDAEGIVRFDALVFAEAGVYTFTITEQIDPEMDDVIWDTNVYTLTIRVVDSGNGTLEIAEISVTSTEGRDDLVFFNVLEEIVTKKDVFVNGDMTISMDGQLVMPGDVLTYTITYTNYTGHTVDLTIVDMIPVHTAFLSADNDGVFADGRVTWQARLEAGESITVSFQVEVMDASSEIVNQATVIDGENQYETNVVVVTSNDPLPETGDAIHIGIMMVAMSTVVLLAILVLDRKKSKFEQ